MEDYSELHNYLLAILESFTKLRYVPETQEKEDNAPKSEVISGGDTFIAQAPLRSPEDFGNTRFWSRQGHVEVDVCPEGGGNLLVTGPGSLTVTGPTGAEVGAKGRLGAVSVEADLIKFAVGNKGYSKQNRMSELVV